MRLIHSALITMLVVCTLATIGCNINKPDVKLEETRTREIMEQAKQTYLDIFLMEEYPEATIDDVSFRPLMGIFNESLVAVFYGGKYHGCHTEYVVETEIGHLTFEWSNGYPILVWNNGFIYQLYEAFDLDLLSREDLDQIFNFYSNVRIKG